MATTLQRRAAPARCPGRTLDTCTSPAAAAWRADIRAWVDEGVASEQIKARLSKRADRGLSIVPQNNTFSLLLWLGAFAGIFGFGVIIRMVRQKKEPWEKDENSIETITGGLTHEAHEELLNEELAEYN